MQVKSIRTQDNLNFMRNTCLIWILLICFISIKEICNAQASKSTVTISGSLERGNHLLDSVFLDIHEDYVAGTAGPQVKFTLKQPVRNGKWKFVLGKVTKPMYISLRSPYTDSTSNADWMAHTLYLFMIEPGDSVNVGFKKIIENPEFTGKSAIKFQWMFESYEKINVKRKSMSLKNAHVDAKVRFRNVEDAMNFQISSLDSIRNSLSSDGYEILKANIIGEQLFPLMEYFTIHQFKQANKDSSFLEETMEIYKEKYMDVKIDTKKQHLYAIAYFYPIYLRFNAFARLLYYKRKNMADTIQIIPLINKLYPKGILRDKIITGLVFFNSNSNKFSDEFSSSALNSIENIQDKKIVLKLIGNLKRGTDITDFKFRDTQGKVVELHQFSGKTIIVDMWFTGCISCIELAKSLGKIEDTYKHNPNLVFVSISIDQKKDIWLNSINPKTKEGGSVKFSNYFASDSTKYLYTDGKGGAHPFIKKYNPNGAFPGLIIIDKHGKLFDAQPAIPVNEEMSVLFLQVLNEALTMK